MVTDRNAKDDFSKVPTSPNARIRKGSSAKGLSVGSKMKILEYVDDYTRLHGKKPTYSTIIRWFHENYGRKIGQGTVTRLFQNEDQIRELANREGGTEIIRNKGAMFPELERILELRIKEAENNDVTLRRQTIRDMAIQIFQELQQKGWYTRSTMNFSNGWLENFRERREIVSRHKYISDGRDKDDAPEGHNTHTIPGLLNPQNEPVEMATSHMVNRFQLDLDSGSYNSAPDNSESSIHPGPSVVGQNSNAPPEDNGTVNPSDMVQRFAVNLPGADPTSSGDLGNTHQQQQHQYQQHTQNALQLRSQHAHTHQGAHQLPLQQHPHQQHLAHQQQQQHHHTQQQHNASIIPDRTPSQEEHQAQMQKLAADVAVSSTNTQGHSDDMGVINETHYRQQQKVHHHQQIPHLQQHSQHSQHSQQQQQQQQLPQQQQQHPQQLQPSHKNPNQPGSPQMIGEADDSKLMLARTPTSSDVDMKVATDMMKQVVMSLVELDLEGRAAHFDHFSTSLEQARLLFKRMKSYSEKMAQQ